MKKVITASLIVAVVLTGAGLIHINTTKASKEITAPAKPDNAKVEYKKNDDKVFKSPDEFISTKPNSPHNRKDAEKVVREKLLYKNIQKVVPEVNDVMHWVDPDRQIYVIISKFKSFETAMGVLTNAKVYTYYDAETGEELGADYKGIPSEEYKNNHNAHK